MPLPAVEFGEKSDSGKDPDKQVNEDSLGHEETRFGHLLVVCDGMGGHEGGKEASQLAVETVLEHFRTAAAAPSVPDQKPSDVLRDAIVLANQRVFAMAGGAAQHARPGSTIVALLVHGDGAEVAHVGDSRGYLVHGSQIFQITKDHSTVQQLVDAGFLTPAQAAVHPNANQITRALGMQQEVDVEVRPQPLFFAAGDAFVLCSDGLSDLVEPPEILRIVGAAPPAQAAGQLVDLANARGGHDNISVQVLRTREASKAQPTALPPTISGTTLPADTSVDETLPATGVRTAPMAMPGAPAGASGAAAHGTHGSTTIVQAPAKELLGAATPQRATQQLAATPPTGVIPSAMVPAVIPPAPPPAPSLPDRDAPPSSSMIRDARRAGRAGGLAPTTILGILLAAIGIGIAVWVIIDHMGDRAGKRKQAPFPLTTDTPPAASSP